MANQGPPSREISFNSNHIQDVTKQKLQEKHVQLQRLQEIYDNILDEKNKVNIQLQTLQEIYDMVLREKNEAEVAIRKLKKDIDETTKFLQNSHNSNRMDVNSPNNKRVGKKKSKKSKKKKSKK